ncbi:hypothetical protein DSO57_1002875 [Entomophthora muscae]|uniref:Uncharacterized protein n=1 Tax=Entomophthora muscae TaxID=34485 RepID=A0ACC2TW10_9FUNG|nr:hypothetical protein DSO57_1002875 [Entomophthora muscae]
MVQDLWEHLFLKVWWFGYDGCFIEKKPSGRNLALVATKLPELPANVSYNTQEAFNESPLDVSNNMNQSDGNVKWCALPPN